MSELSDPPLISEHHVKLPEELSSILRANFVHQQGITGKGIRIAVIDSGFYPHPFFKKRNYKIYHVPTFKEPEPFVDRYGHGTAQLASVFAIAPDAEVIAVKCLERDPSYALQKALNLKPNIISCAWGFHLDDPELYSDGAEVRLPKAFRNLQRLLMKAVEQGICVLAAAGNGQRAFPGSMPEVISVGGVYYAQDGKFSLSDISSKFESCLFPGRRVPDVCGLVGKAPYGRLLLVPVPPKSGLAKRVALRPLQNKKASAWAMFSGTSAATAMLSGAAALMLQANQQLNPEAIKSILIKTSRDITEDSQQKLVDVQAAISHVLNQSSHPHLIR